MSYKVRVMATQDRFAQNIYTLVCWGVLILAAMFLYSILSNLHFPPNHGGSARKDR